MPTTMPKAIAKILTIACDDDRGGRADTESETDGDSDGAVSMTGTRSRHSCYHCWQHHQHHFRKPDCQDGQNIIASMPTTFV